jgi:hypothetical protein
MVINTTVVNATARKLQRGMGASAEMHSRLSRFTSNRITLRQGLEERWYAATWADECGLMAVGFYSYAQGFVTADLDALLAVVSDKGYWLETIGAPDGGKTKPLSESAGICDHATHANGRCLECDSDC